MGPITASAAATASHEASSTNETNETLWQPSVPGSTLAVTPALTLRPTETMRDSPRRDGGAAAAKAAVDAIRIAAAASVARTAGGGGGNGGSGGARSTDGSSIGGNSNDAGTGVVPAQASVMRVEASSSSSAQAAEVAMTRSSEIVI